MRIYTEVAVVVIVCLLCSAAAKQINTDLELEKHLPPRCLSTIYEYSIKYS